MKRGVRPTRDCVRLGLSIAVGVCVGAWLAGCAATGPRAGDEFVDRDQGRSGWSAGWPFAPAEIRVHPLTRVGDDAQGRPELTLHLDVRDEWGDATKSVGNLGVVLSRVGAGGAGDGEIRWSLNLSDPEVNSAFFDPATRTYRVRLGELPVDLVGEGVRLSIGGGGATPVAMLTVTLRTYGPNGEPRSLRDQIELVPR